MTKLFYAQDLLVNLVVVASKIVDYILITRAPYYVEICMLAFNDRLTFRSVASGAALLRFYCRPIDQVDDESSMVDADYKLSEL